MCVYCTGTIIRIETNYPLTEANLFRQYYMHAFIKCVHRKTVETDVAIQSGNWACKWHRKRSPFMSAKLSLGDIMATKMHAGDDTIVNIN